MQPTDSASPIRNWLLDHNMPARLAEWLSAKGISCSTVRQEKWDEITNGELVEKACEKYQVLLTRDRGFAVSAAGRLRASNLAVVLVTIPQSRAKEYMRHFEKYWSVNPIHPDSGKMIEWP